MSTKTLLRSALSLALAASSLAACDATPVAPVAPLSPVNGAANTAERCSGDVTLYNSSVTPLIQVLLPNIVLIHETSSATGLTTYDLRGTGSYSLLVGPGAGRVIVSGEWSLSRGNPNNLRIEFLSGVMGKRDFLLLVVAPVFLSDGTVKFQGNWYDDAAGTVLPMEMVTTCWPTP